MFREHWLLKTGRSERSELLFLYWKR